MAAAPNKNLILGVDKMSKKWIYDEMKNDIEREKEGEREAGRQKSSERESGAEN